MGEFGTQLGRWMTAHESLDAKRACWPMWRALNLQWGKHDRALAAISAAAESAIEEVTGRPTIRSIVRELATTAPVTVRRDTRHFARTIGIRL